MSSYRDLIPYGPPSHFQRKNTAPRATNEEKGSSGGHSSSADLLKQKKISLVEFKIEMIVSEGNNDDEKVKYYKEKYEEVKKVLLDEYDEQKFVKIVQDETLVDELQKIKVALLENKSCNLL